MTDRYEGKRKADLALIHMTGKALFGDVSRGGLGREEYEDWLEVRTGKRSAADLDTGERIALLKAIRREGLLPERSRGGRGPTRDGRDRPTTQQWAKIAALGRSMGWQGGLEDKRLHGFVTRTVKVASPRFITRAQATAVITGLEAWARQIDEDGDAVS